MMRLTILFILIIIANNAFAGSLADGSNNAQSLIGQVNQSAPLSLDPKSSVPGFVSSVPAEVEYSNGSMSDAATKKAQTDTAAQLIKKSFATRPDIKIDRENSAIFNNAKHVTDNPDAIVNNLTGKYGDCKAQSQTTNSTDIRTCDEYSETADQTCQVGQNIVVDTKHNYQCHRSRNYTDHTCNKSLTLTCNQYSNCAAGGIVPSSIASDMMWVYNGNQLTIGTIEDNYWHGTCTIFERNTYFTIDSLTQIGTFALTEVNFDDYIEIRLNGTLVYKDSLSSSPLEKITACDLHRNWRVYSNINLKPYLKEGNNTLNMKVLVGGAGEGWFHITTQQKCCSSWTESWSDGCVGYTQ